MNKREKLVNLKENEKIIKYYLKYYEPVTILEELQEIDKKIEEFVAKRDKLVERQSNSSVKLIQFRRELIENRLKQKLVIGSNDLLKKLAKTVKSIKETEKILVKV